MKVEGTETMTDILKDDESNKTSDESEEVFDPNKTIKHEDENSQTEFGSDGNCPLNNASNNFEEDSEMPISPKVEDPTRIGDSAKCEDATKLEGFPKVEDPTKVEDPIKVEDPTKLEGPTKVEDSTKVDLPTKVEDVSKELAENSGEGPSSVETKRENEILMNKAPLEDTKSPFKICRLCLVFVDDNFIPLEKVMVMLQIVLPEVVSAYL